MSEPDPKLLNLESAIAETRRLREENARLQRLLQEHGIQIPGFPFTDGIPVATSEPSGARTPTLKAEQRIALFRDLFHGRDDVYVVRWENVDGRSGYMPKADRDWKAYLRAKGEDRKKVDRQTLSRVPRLEVLGSTRTLGAGALVDRALSTGHPFGVVVRATNSHRIPGPCFQ
jgi:hypothetical protein